VGQRPPAQEIYIKKEETKLQEGGTYVRPNQWLGKGTSKERNNR
jgi:hypothetical protein